MTSLQGARCSELPQSRDYERFLDRLRKLIDKGQSLEEARMRQKANSILLHFGHNKSLKEACGVAGREVKCIS